ncbi:PIR protein [Plasmodium yoelii]|uniref:PIR protein n=2 Tax=Plasmodium yoelii TaxID=5861 RepID=A0AAF0B4M7_PLAYO|nr:PIR protein [Plasmodium yoelii]WBY56520.1 PIR protein [Plasmodium yoelii yoelii]CDU17384.1 YIR protein [Plasmodium yoelii]VTZ77044.1 PIR protein [Plasmodium yoelii]|eukprot:XP_022811880.1 PIR protein [Plasmodium yoelii]
MDYKLCGRFRHLRNYFPDELGKISDYDFHDNGKIEKYCPIVGSKNKCETEAYKINAGCLWLLEQNIVNRISDLSKDQAKAFIMYIMIWLIYMLNLKKDKNINYLKDFYEANIKDNSHYTNCKKGNIDCSNSLKNKLGYNNFKEIIKENEYFMNMDMNIISNFYDAFKSLCNMYIEYDASSPDCNQISQDANEFAEKYKKLNDDSNNTDGSSHSQILSILSNDYDNFKKKYNNDQYCKSLSLPTIEKKKNIVKSSEKMIEQISEVASSSSSIANKLIIALSIFAAIPIFWGFSYKYSLFGFRKRAQKQHLRKKLKK